jgi:hypothetical protein
MGGSSLKQITIENVLVVQNMQNSKQLDAKRLKQHYEKFVQAKKCTPSQYPDGEMVYLELVSKDLEFGINGYFYSVAQLELEMLDLIEQGQLTLGDLPHFCWGCKRIYMSRLSAEDIIDSSVEDLHEDAADSLSDHSVQELDDALSKFYAANRQVFSFECDQTIAVLLEWSWLPKALGSKLGELLSP